MKSCLDKLSASWCVAPSYRHGHCSAYAAHSACQGFFRSLHFCACLNSGLSGSALCKDNSELVFCLGQLAAIGDALGRSSRCTPFFARKPPVSFALSRWSYSLYIYKTTPSKLTKYFNPSNWTPEMYFGSWFSMYISSDADCTALHFMLWYRNWYMHTLWTYPINGRGLVFLRAYWMCPTFGTRNACLHLSITRWFVHSC